MISWKSKLNRSQIVLVSLLIFLCALAAPNQHNVKAVQCLPVTISPISISDGTVGVAYSQNLNALGGGSLKFTFAIIANSLPPGLTLTPASGLIAGTPTTTGAYSFLVRATAANGCTGTRAYTITIACGTITFEPATLPSVTIGTSYSQTIQASDGRAPYTYTVIFGGLPPGLTLASSTGRISGIPAPGSGGTRLFDVKVTDANSCSTTKRYSIEVICPSITTSPNSFTGLVNAPVNLQLSANGGTSPYTYDDGLNPNNVPPGLTFSSTGLISGTPTAPGTYNIAFAVIDANSCISPRTITANITTCTTITVNPATLNAGTAGVPYSRAFSASGGTGPYTFGTNASALPAGLTLSTSGQLNGTPTTAGNYNFIVRSTDANGCFGERSYTLVINPACPIITVNPAALPVGQIGLSYSVAFSAIGGTGPYAFTMNGPPPNGLSLNSNGSLTGTPTAARSYPFTVTATDVNGCTGERSYTLVINSAACPAISIDTYDPACATGGRCLQPNAYCGWRYGSLLVQHCGRYVGTGIIAVFERASDRGAIVFRLLPFYRSRDGCERMYR